MGPRQFSQLLQDTQFATTAITLMAQLASIDKLLQNKALDDLGQDRSSTRFEELETSTICLREDPGEAVSRSAHDPLAESVTSNVQDDQVRLVRTSGDEPTRESILSRLRPNPEQSMVPQTTNKTTASADKSHKRVIDEVFQGLL